jgi:hypothetical protein
MPFYRPAAGRIYGGMQATELDSKAGQSSPLNGPREVALG